VVEGACSRIRRLPQAPSTILRMVPLPRWGRTGAPVMCAHPCQPLTFLADICDDRRRKSPSCGWSRAIRRWMRPCRLRR
jgi:hypothetical protein